MTRDLFRRYVWLVDTVKNGKRMTFDEISHAWDISSFNIDGSKLALRTFHNHREAIELLFGIRILCNRSDHHYYISEDDSQMTNLKLWMLQSLSFDHLVKLEAKEVENRMILDETPEQKFGIISLIEAMKRGRTVRFFYPSDTQTKTVEKEIEPYAIRFLDNTWYVLGKEKNAEDLKMFSLPLITDLKLTDTKFQLPFAFCAADFFAKFIGTEVDSGRNPEKIKLKTKGKIRNEIKLRPLHKSQKEVNAGPDFSLMEIEAVPTDDFINKLIALGDEIEIVEPQSLRNSIRQRLESISSLYETK